MWRQYGERHCVERDGTERDSAQRDSAQRDSAQRDSAERDSTERDSMERDNAVTNTIHYSNYQSSCDRTVLGQAFHQPQNGGACSWLDGLVCHRSPLAGHVHCHGEKVLLDSTANPALCSHT